MKHLATLAATLVLAGTLGAQTPWDISAIALGSPQPSVRERPACASDGDVLYLSGGNNGTTSSVIYDDLWSFDLDTIIWTEITADGAGFGERAGHAMVWDEARGKLVVFGGVTAPWPTRLGDTWEWDSVNGWVDVTPAGASPSPRSFMAHAYVPGLGLVVHAGQQSSAPHASDTWAWDGTSWTMLATGPERNVSAMAYRPAPDDDLILFGGTVSATGGTRYDETWRFDVATSTWTQLAPATTPPGAVGMALFYDAFEGVVVMHGGNAATNPTDDAWTFDGDWNLEVLGINDVGPARRNAGVAYVSSWNKGVIACGHDGTGRQNDLWYRGYLATFVPVGGGGCAGPAGPVASFSGSAPLIGETFTLTMGDTSPGTFPFAVVGFTLLQPAIPLSLLAPPSPAGCLLYANPLMIDPMVAGAGSATLSVPLPNDASILGATFFAQGVQAGFTPGLTLYAADYGVGTIGN